MDNGRYRKDEVQDTQSVVEEYDSENEFKYMLKYSGYLRSINRGNLLWGFFKKNIIIESKQIMGGYFTKFYSFDSGPKFLAMYLARNKKCIHIKRPIIIDINTPGRGVMANDFNFLKESWQKEVPCDEMKKVAIPDVEFMVNSWYFIGQEYLWILHKLKNAGYDCSAYSLNVPGMLARIYHSVRDERQHNIPENVLSEQKAIIKRTLKHFSLDEKAEFYRIYNKYWNFIHNEDRYRRPIVYWWNELTWRYPIILELYNRTQLSIYRKKKKEEKEAKKSRERERERGTETGVECTLLELIEENVSGSD